MERARAESVRSCSGTDSSQLGKSRFCGYDQRVRSRGGRVLFTKGETLLKAFFAALAVGAFALFGGASAATSAPSHEHLIVGYKHVPTAADRAAIASVGGKIRREFGAISAIAVDLPSGKAASLRSQTGVSYVETDGVKTPLSLSSTLPTSQLVPSIDNGLYGLVTTHTVEAQAAGFKGQGIMACVADTGIDTQNPDIAPNLVDTYDVFSGKSGLHATDVYDLHVQV